ncbi:MAG: electron transport complex subunit RsxC [Gammaproteobacteria bacterium HGW-Gammaproteobacteria-2]|nr:MAG: electron transport complex subunit RsxC [Gammaproteobacteria bacterium HGW-Gammaproteobacteria-2]
MLPKCFPCRCSLISAVGVQPGALNAYNQALRRSHGYIRSPVHVRLHHFHGGLSLPQHKASSAGQPIGHCPLPAELDIPLLQHSGASAQACVASGDHVLAGQLIGNAVDGRSANVHSPASGTVLAISERALAHPPGVVCMHVRIAVDCVQRAVTPLPTIDWQQADTGQIVERARQCGIVGMGGAGFPSAEKLAITRDTLILNGAECEPYIACDDRLLREHANDVVMGGRVMRRATGAARVLLAVETAMPEALAACTQAITECGAGEIELVAVPTVYPAGGERQLIRVLTGDEVPRGGLPRDIGVVVQNVATARALWRAIAHGEASTRRIVSVTGPGVQRPGNWDVAIGTPISHVLAQAGGYSEAAARLIIGGPMMGVALANDDYPISKTSNCVLVLAASQLRDPATEMPCIRCGDCAVVCPAQLLPQQLLAQVRGEQWPRAQQQGIFDCIECGCCDLACPSQIPLTQHFRHGKTELRVRALQAEQANAARLRHEHRQQRLSARDKEREQRHSAQQKALSTTDAVTTAIARAKARRDAQETDPS